ncbi:MAG: adenosylhomocysteine nucleosidase [Verrucomicrobiota bacterium]|nr:adenosylhomocysteine nucleosidase [Verrucomicrobiota bacterium]
MLPTPAPTLILSAMPSEIRLIQAEFVRLKSGRLACLPFVEGRLRGRCVITTVTDVGVTNAAMITALFVGKFHPAEVLVSGTGSRFNPRIRTGDTVISTKTIHHAAGSLTDRGMVYRRVRSLLPGQMPHWFCRPDARLLRLAKAAIAGYVAEPVPAIGETHVPRARPSPPPAPSPRNRNDPRLPSPRSPAKVRNTNFGFHTPGSFISESATWRYGQSSYYELWFGRQGREASR